MDLLYQEHHQWLYQWLSRRLNCINDAADLSHDTYLRMMVSQRLPKTKHDCRPFLMQVAKGLVIDLHRRRALETAYLEALAQVPEHFAPSVEQSEIILAALVKIDNALDALPEKVREAFLLSRFEGKTYAQIAQCLSMSVASIRKYMAQAAAACFFALDEEELNAF